MNYIVSFFDTPIPDYARIIETQSRVIATDSFGKSNKKTKRK